MAKKGSGMFMSLLLRILHRVEVIKKSHTSCKSSNRASIIKKSFSNQYRTILIITGKGKEGTGVLRNKLPGWLKSDFCSPYILAFGQAKEKDGGSGAFYIRLRRNRSKS